MRINYFISIILLASLLLSCSAPKRRCNLYVHTLGPMNGDTIRYEIIKDQIVFHTGKFQSQIADIYDCVYVSSFDSLVFRVPDLGIEDSIIVKDETKMVFLDITYNIEINIDGQLDTLGVELMVSEN